MRLLNLTRPPMRGPDVTAVQRALGVRATGAYNATTAAAVAEWKRRVGYPEDRITNFIGVDGQRWLLGLEPIPRDYFARGQERALAGLAPRLRSATPPFGTGSAPRVALRWPIQPFDQPHPIRATFGEPRGLVDVGGGRVGAELANYLATLNPVSVPGRRIVHHGIDIVAADLTPVYSHVSGTARLGGGSSYGRFVRVGDFEYVHLTDPVAEGSRVVAFQTVIGRVYPGQEHVHLSRYVNGHPVNQLAFGGLVGYEDTSPPRLDELIGYRPNGTRANLSALAGPVALCLNGADPQSQGGHDAGIYSLSYAVLDRDGSAAVGPFHLFQMDALPPEAVGNMLYTVQSTRHKFTPLIWYRLTTKSPTADGFLHADALPEGDYLVHVAASDVNGNLTRRDFPITVAPRV